MDIVSLVSAQAHRVWEVDAVRRRLITPATDTEPAVYEEVTIRVVVHLDVQDWGGGGAAEVVARQDLVSVRGDVLAAGDKITVSDPSAVATSTTWVVTGRAPESGDTHVTVWRLRQVTS